MVGSEDRYHLTQVTLDKLLQIKAAPTHRKCHAYGETHDIKMIVWLFGRAAQQRRRSLSGLYSLHVTGRPDSRTMHVNESMVIQLECLQQNASVILS